MTPQPAVTEQDLAAIEAYVRRTVDEATISDIHTHLFPPAHGELLLWGVDELLTYHYLVAELFTIASRELTPEAFWCLPKAQQADMVWEHVFVRHGALSEAARGVLTTLSAFGLDVRGRDLPAMRRWFTEQEVSSHLAKVFELAGLDYAVMTNNPFVPAETTCWDQSLPVPTCLRTALRIDPLTDNWPAAAKAMNEAGYDVQADASGRSTAEARRFLADWIKRIDPMYLAASMPNTFAYPADDRVTHAIDEVILPTAREFNLPVALMIGVRRGVNPPLRDGGDAVGVSDVTAVQHLCANHPDVKFLVTMLSRVNQHELCVCARKFGNLHVFGCWWFCNNPSIIDEMTRQRLELLGATFTAQHSDARVLDQLVYKWTHSRRIVADVLAEKYRDLAMTGWLATKDEIARDVRAIFGGAFEAFLGK